MQYESNDPYTYDNSLVLINKFNIKNADNLTLIEQQIYNAKIKLPTPKGVFDLKHLQAIHKHLFGDIYDWAGKPREVNIAKKTEYAGTTMFAYFHRIEPELNKIFSRLESEHPIECSQDELIKIIAEYFNEVNAVHPFREGNGRANRLFFSELAKQSGYIIEWDKMNKDDYINASIQGTLSVDYAPLEKLISENIEPIHPKIDQEILIEEIKNEQEIAKSVKNHEPKNGISF